MTEEQRIEIRAALHDEETNLVLGALVRIERVRTGSMIRIRSEVPRGVSIVNKAPITPLNVGLSFLKKHRQDGSDIRIKEPRLVLGGLSRLIQDEWMR